MCFGFSIGDFITVLEKANKLRKDFASAPERFHGISADIKNLDLILQDTRDFEAANELSKAQEERLAIIVANSSEVLQDIQDKLNKYSFLGSKPDSTKDRVRRVWERVKFEPEDIRDFRSRLTATIAALDAFNNRTIREDVSKLSIGQNRHQNQQILDWLATTDFAIQHSNHIEKRLEGTVQWLFDAPEYKTWVDTPGQVLHLHGIQGAGKTVLAASIIHDLQQKITAEKDAALCYFYCDFNRRKDQTLVAIVSSLLRQLAQASVVFPAGVQQLYEKHQKFKTKPSLKEVRQVLTVLVKESPKLYIVLDALDELEATEKLQQDTIIELLQLQKTIPAQLLFTSRSILPIMESLSGHASLEIRTHDDDIGRYVLSRARNLSCIDPSNSKLIEKIKQEIVGVADGMLVQALDSRVLLTFYRFLLADLAMEALQGHPSPRELRITLAALRTSGNTYEKAYSSTMQRICHQSPGLKNLAIDALTWIVYARRPLTTNELRTALAIEIGDTEFDEEALSRLDLIVSACCGLVYVEQDSEIIRLVHYTTQEFFKGIGAKLLRFPGDLELAQKCVTYISMDHFSEGACRTLGQVRARLKQFPLYRYSCEFAIDHSAMVYQAMVDPEKINFFLDFSQKHEHIQAAYQPINDHRVTHPEYYDDSANAYLAGVSPLQFAANRNALSIIPVLLRTCDINSQDSSGGTPLHGAVNSGHADMVRCLIQAGADVSLHPSNTTNLRAGFRYREITAALLEANPEALLEEADEKGSTPLHYAARWYPEFVVMLLDAGAKVDSCDDHGTTPLFEAVSMPTRRFTIDDRLEVIRALLEHGADCNHQDCDGQTPLSKALRVHTSHDTDGGLEVIRALLEHGADCNHQDSKGRTPLFEVITSVGDNRPEVIRALLEHGADCDHQDGYGETPLFEALRIYAWRATDVGLEMIRALLEHGADYNHQNSKGRTPLFEVITSGGDNRLELIRALLKYGADCNHQDSKGRTPLFEVITSRGDNLLEVIRALLEHGADCNHQDGYGETPLFDALRMYTLHATDDWLEVVRALLKYRADCNHQDHYGLTPMHHLVHCFRNYRKSSTEDLPYIDQIGDILLHNGAQLEIQDNRGSSPLTSALNLEQKWMALFLLRRGSDITSIDHQGRTCFHHVLRSRQITDSSIQHEILQSLAFLLGNIGTRNENVSSSQQQNQEATATSTTWRNLVYISDRFGRGALHFAAESGAVDCLDFLLKNGFETDELDALAGTGIELRARDNYGRNPLDYACVSGDLGMATRILQLYGQDTTPSLWTPLHWACLRGDFKLLKMLADEGYKATITNTVDPPADWSPLDIAIYNKNENLITSDGDLRSDLPWQELLACGLIVKNQGLEESITALRMNRFSKPGPKWRHQCDGCVRSGFHGPRFHCRICFDFDLCFMCKATSAGNHAGHEWDRIDGHEYAIDDEVEVEDENQGEEKDEDDG